MEKSYTRVVFASVQNMDTGYESLIKMFCMCGANQAGSSSFCEFVFKILKTYIILFLIILIKILFFLWVAFFTVDINIS